MIESTARTASSILFGGVLAATVSCMAEDDPDDLGDELEYRGYDDHGDDECAGHDHEPPHVVPKPPKELWPPNHSWHVITPEDCFAAVHDCDPDVHIKFLWASSDEPKNDIGDGNTDKDIEFVDEKTVKLRAERMGPGDGRVYEIKWVAKDSHHNASSGYCIVTVPHDQGGDAAVDSGAEYTKYNSYAYY